MKAEFNIVVRDGRHRKHLNNILKKYNADFERGEKGRIHATLSVKDENEAKEIKDDLLGRCRNPSKVSIDYEMRDEVNGNEKAGKSNGELEAKLSESKRINAGLREKLRAVERENQEYLQRIKSSEEKVSKLEARLRSVKESYQELRANSEKGPAEKILELVKAYKPECDLEALAGECPSKPTNKEYREALEAVKYIEKAPELVRKDLGDKISEYKKTIEIYERAQKLEKEQVPVLITSEGGGIRVYFPNFEVCKRDIKRAFQDCGKRVRIEEQEGICTVEKRRHKTDAPGLKYDVAEALEKSRLTYKICIC